MTDISEMRRALWSALEIGSDLGEVEARRWLERFEQAIRVEAEAAMRERCAAFVMDRSKKAASLRQLAKRRADADAEQVFVQLWKELEMMAHNISALPLSETGDKL
jgi:hypothetical protein